MNTHNLCFRGEIRKIMHTPKPQFYCTKVGFKGVKLYRHVFVMFRTAMIGNVGVQILRVILYSSEKYFKKT